MTKAVTLKAYAVNDKDESSGAIYFAPHNIGARRAGANEYGDGELSYVTCNRAPWADHCAETGIVPVSLMVEHGWHFDCCGCGVRIDEDLCYLYDDEIEEPETCDRAIRYKGWTPAAVIGHQHSAVFCMQSCEDEHDAYVAERKRRQDRAIGRFKAIILRRFPGVEFVDITDGYRTSTHANAYKHKGRWRISQIHVPFNFPGQQHGPASLDYDPDSSWSAARKPRWMCAGGDKDAFEAFAATTKRKAA